MIHTCVVGGWTEPRGSRPFFGALLVGVTDEQGELRYVGRVASGFTDAQLGLVWKPLHALKTKTRPLPSSRTRKTRSLGEADARGSVQFSGWTRDGRLRHPVFVGLEAPSSAKLRRAGWQARAGPQRAHSVAADATRRD